MTREQIEKIAKRYGIGIEFKEPGEGGFIFDASKRVEKELGDLKGRLFSVESENWKNAMLYEVTENGTNLFAA